MIKKILIVLGVIFIVLAGYVGYIFMTTESHSPKATAQYDQAGLSISVNYCQPYKKGRLIFGPESAGALQPWGTYWRLGANAATEITLNSPVLFGGKQLAAGSYRMYAVPGESQWTVGLNSQLGEWGYSEPDYTLDVLKVEVPAQKLDEELEQFEISFHGNGAKTDMLFKWADAQVAVPIEKQ